MNLDNEKQVDKVTTTDSQMGAEEPKNTSTPPSNNPNEAGESQVQEGQNIVNEEDQNHIVNDEGIEEYIKQVNVNTKLSNENPVQGGKGMTL